MSRTLWIVLGVAMAAGLAVLLLAPAWILGPAGTDATDEVRIETPAVAPVEATPESLPADEMVETLDEMADSTDTEEMDESTEPIPGLVEDSAPAYAIDGVIEEGEYAGSAVISGVHVYWSNNTETLKVGLASPGTGYVAIGFDPDRRMEGANFILAYVEEGEITIRDDYGIGLTSHGPDVDRAGQDNILAAAGVQWGDQTIVEFIIPLDSGDPTDKPLRPGGTYAVLVAYHDLRDELTLRHSRRGTGEITLQSF